MIHKLDKPTAVIALIALLNTMGFGLIIPVMPELLAEFRAGSVARAAAIGGYLSLSFAVMQFLFSPLLGALSDRFGRRPVLMASLAVKAADYLLMALAPSLWLIFVGRLVSGAGSATYAVAYAYLADRAPDKERARLFGIIGAAGGMGFVLGPFAGGLIGTLGTRAPFMASAALTLAALIATHFVVRESLPPAERRPIAWQSANPFGPLTVRNTGVPVILFAAFFLDAMAGFSFPAVWAYFGAARYGWDSTMIGLSFGIMGLSYAVMQSAAIGPLTGRLGNINTARLALVVAIPGYLVLVWLPWGLVAMVLMLPLTLRAITGTVLTAQASTLTGNDRQGEIQGTLSSTNALASMIAYPLMTQVFTAQMEAASGESWRAGAPFLLAAGFSIIALLLLALDRTRHERGNAP